jgi:hypothetical protein
MLLCISKETISLLPDGAEKNEKPADLYLLKNPLKGPYLLKNQKKIVSFEKMSVKNP